MDEMRYQLDLLRAMTHKLNDSDFMYRFICDTSNSAIFYYSFQTEILKTLGQAERYFDFTIENPRDYVKIFDVIDEEYVKDLRNLLFLERELKNSETLDCKVKDSQKWFQFRTDVLYDENKKPIQKAIRVRDITDMKKQNDELRYMAYYDTLTGLYNRNYFVLRLNAFIEKAQEEQAVVSVLIVDIDHFRKINDGMGILVGDDLVMQFGQFLKQFSNERVLVSHMTSDIFCLAIYNPMGNNSIEHIHQAIREQGRAGFSVHSEQTVTFTVGIGVAEYPEASVNALELINYAEIVMFQAKKAGKDNIQYFNNKILDAFLKTVEMENYLKLAVEKNELAVFYQPQYDAKTGRLRGMEALLRWTSPQLGQVSPAVFIPVAEKSGSIIPIGNWVMEECLRQYREWKRKYLSNFLLSINISSIQFMQGNFTYQLLDALKKYDIAPENVEIEVTESILIVEFEYVKEKLQLLRDYGIRISLDDFGTGFSSLAYLKGLPVDTIKIDKSFIDTIAEDRSTYTIAESIVSMIHKLGFESIAEGVETKEQLVVLQEMGCKTIQGYYFSKPLPVDAMDNLLTKLL